MTVHPLSLAISSAVNVFSLVFLTFAVFRMLYAWRTLSCKRYLYTAAGFTFLGAGLLAETLSIYFSILIIPTSFIGGMPKLLLKIFVEKYPFYILYLLGYLLLLISYTRDEENLFVSLLASFSGQVWLIVQGLSTALAIVLTLVSARRNANPFVVAGFGLLAISHVFSLVLTPRYVMISSIVRAAAFFLLIVGMGVLHFARKEE